MSFDLWSYVDCGATGISVCSMQHSTLKFYFELILYEFENYVILITVTIGMLSPLPPKKTNNILYIFEFNVK